MLFVACKTTFDVAPPIKELSNVAFAGILANAETSASVAVPPVLTISIFVGSSSKVPVLPLLASVLVKP